MGEASSKRRVIIIALLIINLLVTGTLLTLEIVESCSASQLQEQYTLYIGTNDKDTNKQEIPFDECRTRVEEVCLQYVSGFTITEADGAWTDDMGNIVREKTLVCYISGAATADIDAIVDQLLIDLNQSSIMVETEKLSCVMKECSSAEKIE